MARLYPFWGLLNSTKGFFLTCLYKLIYKRCLFKALERKQLDQFPSNLQQTHELVLDHYYRCTVQEGLTISSLLGRKPPENLNLFVIKKKTTNNFYQIWVGIAHSVP